MTTYKHANPVLTRRLPERRYLPELHGVRGLALAGVVLFHLFGNGRVSGGIDIFLTVSGFLFTGMLLREAATSGGRIDPLKYYGRLIRRILVPAAIVIIATLTAGLLISPVTQHQQLWAEARSSLLYFENIELINSQLAYGAAGPETSPFQHFWSLSVQGQFYIVWPALAIVAVLIAKRLHTSAARIMGTLIGVVFIASFVYATWVGSYNQDEAYLMTTTRAWELAFGGLLALAGGTIRLPKPFRAPAGWLGLALVVSCGFVFDGSQLFPGPWALYPLVGLTLVLISAGPQGGNNDPMGSATHFLSNKPLAWIGDHAYGLYLWHWPLLIYYMELRDREAIGWRGAIVILAITVILAMLTYRYIEQPLKHRQERRTQAIATRVNKAVITTAAASLALAGVAVTPFTTSSTELHTTFGDLDPEIYPGAAQDPAQPPPQADPFPALEEAGAYSPAYVSRDCHQLGGNGSGAGEVRVCDDETKPEAPTATIVLAGGSHAGHLEAAFQALSEKYDWEVKIVMKSTCVFGSEKLPDQQKCGEWTENFINWLEDNPADLVVTPATALPEEDGPEYIYDAAPTWWQRITDTGTDLLLVRGMPRQEHRAPDCLAKGGTSQECGPSKEGYAETNPLLELDLPDGAYPVDVVEDVCPNLKNSEVENCDAIVGNILISYDNHHLTAPLSQSLAPAFEREMQEVVPHLIR